MVIYIDRTVFQELSSREMTKDESYFFIDLASGCRRGNYYLCGNLESLKTLRKNVDSALGEIYQEIVDHYAEHGAILNTVSMAFILTFNSVSSKDSLPEVLKSTDRLYYISIPFCLQERWSLFDGCCILGENLDDDEFYKCIGENFCLQTNIGGIQLRFRNEPGGGSTISDQLVNIVKNIKEPVLCIVDSDKKYESDDQNHPAPIGDTLRRAQNSALQLEQSGVSPPFQLFALHVHEVENLIPLGVLREIEKQVPQLGCGLDFLERLATIQNGQPVLFYDFKKGFPYISDVRQRQYWEQVLIALHENPSKMPPIEKPEECGDACPSFFIGLGKNSPLRRATTIINEVIKTNHPIGLDRHIEPIWIELGSLIYSWGCANNPIRI